MIKTVLIQCGDLIENHERILSACIQLKQLGYTPVALLYSDNGSFFDQFSIDYIKLSDHYPKDIKSLTITDTHYNDICMLEKLKGKVPETFSRYNVCKLWHACHNLIEEHKIDIIFVWNGHTGVVANCLRVIKERGNIPGGYLERGLLKGTSFFDTIGVNGGSELALGSQNVKVSNGNVDTILEEEFNINRSTYTKNFKSDKEKIIFVPLQVQGDTNIILYSERIKLMRNLALEGVQLAQRLGSEWRVVVRPHPEEDPTVDLNLPEHPLIVVRKDTQLYDEILASTLVLTINSTVGLEAAILGRYVITTGAGIYTSENFVRSLEEVKNVSFDLESDFMKFYSNREENYAELSAYLSILISKYHFIPRKYASLYQESAIEAALEEDILRRIPNGIHPVSLSAFQMLKRITKNARTFYIDVFINHSHKVNITYRKANVPVDLDFVKKRIMFYTHHTSVTPILNIDIQNRIPASIAIFPSNYKGDKMNLYSIVFDEKMNLHPALLGNKVKKLHNQNPSKPVQKAQKINTQKALETNNVTLKKKIARLRRKYLG